METRDAGTCVAEIDGATLSAWRDTLLPPAEMERVRGHVRSCGTCQAQLARYDEVARALRRQREIEPGDRVVEGVRQSILHQSPRRWTPSSRAWGSVSALASVAAVLLLFVYVLEIGPLGHLRPGRQATAVPMVTPTPTPVPTIGPSAFTPVVPLQDAWGAKAQIAQVSTQLDATHVFWTDSSTPDGHKLLGRMRVADSSGTWSWSSTIQAGILDVTTRQFTPVGDRLMASPQLTPWPWDGCGYSDARFVICTDQLEPASLGPAQGVIKLWSYDLVSGQARFITDSSKYPFGQMLVSHGLLLLPTVSQVGIVNLTTNTLSLLSLPTKRPFAMDFSWPYLVYGDQHDVAKPLKVRARDLATGLDIALPQVDAMYVATNNADGNHLPYLALTGDTLFVSLATGRIQSSNVPPNDVTGPDAATTLYELDNLFDGSAQLRPVARYHGVAGPPIGANARLVVYRPLAWDRAEDRWVKFSSLPDGQGPRAALNGIALGLYQPFDARNPTAGQEATIYDTARLGTAGG
jgi:hypothetical protein